MKLFLRQAACLAALLAMSTTTSNTIMMAYASPVPFSSTGAAELVQPLVSDAANIIPNQYMVVFKDTVDEAAIAEHHSWLASFVDSSVQLFDDHLSPQYYGHKKPGHGIHSVFDIPAASPTDNNANDDNDESAPSPAVRGYVGTFQSSEILQILTSPAVAFVEPDQMVFASELEEDAPWGLARVAHRAHPEGVEQHHYAYLANTGESVIAYVVDTGVNIKHVEFEGTRAIWGATIPDGDPDADGNGHGTHVAGTIAGKTYGVAKKAFIKAVKVLRSNGSGTMSDVVAGVEWVAKDHKKRVDEEAAKFEAATGGKETPAPAPKKVKSVANMSLGGGKSRALDLAVNAVVSAGVHFAVAAGNDNRDACNYSPAAAEKAITVGATTIEDSRAWFSNWGKCVDIFGPGHQILSSWIGSTNATNTISGTSMASPHIAGVVASLLSRPEYEDLSPVALKRKLATMANKNAINMGIIPPWGGKTKNLLVFSDPPAHEDKKPEGDEDEEMTDL